MYPLAMEQTHRYTVFPNLHPTNSAPTTAIVDSGVFDLPQNSTQESILLAWAGILHGHVLADSAVFRVDDEAVIVEFNGRKIEYTTDASIHTTVEDRETGRYSAVYFAAVSVLHIPLLILQDVLTSCVRHRIMYFLSST